MYYLNDLIAEERESNNGVEFVRENAIRASFKSAQLRGFNDASSILGRGISVVNKASSRGTGAFNSLFRTPRPVREIEMTERSSNGVSLEETSNEYNANESLDFVIENGIIMKDKQILVRNSDLNPEYLYGNLTHSFGDTASIHIKEIPGPTNNKERQKSEGEQSFNDNFNRDKFVSKSVDTENSHNYYPYTDARDNRHHILDYRKKSEKYKNVIHRHVVARLNFEG